MDANAGSEFLMGRPFDDFLRDGSI